MAEAEAHRTELVVVVEGPNGQSDLALDILRVCVDAGHHARVHLL